MESAAMKPRFPYRILANINLLGLISLTVNIKSSFKRTGVNLDTY